MSNESGERFSKGNSEQERRKLLLTDLHGAMTDYLYGTVMLNVLAQVNLDTDSDGSVALHVLDNLKAMLKKASEMTPDEDAKIKFDNMQAFLAPY